MSGRQFIYGLVLISLMSCDSSEVSTHVWTKTELKAFEGKPVQAMIERIGKPWYEDLEAERPFVKFEVALKSELSGETMRHNLTVMLNPDDSVLSVEIEGGLKP